jgi:hypothetical protein
MVIFFMTLCVDNVPLESIKEMLDSGVFRSYPDIANNIIPGGYSHLLSSTIESGREDVLSELLGRGAIAEDYFSLFLSAIRNSELGMVKLLLLYGGNPDQGTTQYGYTARASALSMQRSEILKLFDSWCSIRALWVVRSVDEVRHVAPCPDFKRARLAPRSQFKRFPKDLARMLGKFLV